MQIYVLLWASLAAQMVKKICLQYRRPGFDPLVGKIPQRKEWLLTPIFLPGEFHGEELGWGGSPWGGKELDTTEQLTLSLFYYFPPANAKISESVRIHRNLYLK